MSPLKRIVRLAFLLSVILIVAAGCGTTNDQNNIFNPATGQHPDGWFPLPELHVSAARQNVDACKECHGELLDGGISKLSCTTCHTNGMIMNETVALTGCISCHGDPPSGTTYPNRSGAHAAHNALPNVTSVCGTCHEGAGTMTPEHFNGVVNVQLLTTYSAKTGTATYNPVDNTCSQISCHGGQTPPAWLSGRQIDVNTQCTACHIYGTTEYNSYNSGQHGLHVNQMHIDCIYCHDTRKLAVNHFTTLNTPEMEGPASATIYDTINYTNGTCATPQCHGVRSWF
jgi:predicted CxxxxCH...CXXCH cytochrome family protein